MVGMRVALVSHEASMGHDTGYGHPERPARVPAVLAGVRTAGHPVVELAAAAASVETLALVHSATYVETLHRFCAGGGGHLDPDTVAGEASWEAALRSAGAGLTAIEALEEGAADLGFVAMRPPGHHALVSRAMGFCLFNNVAVAARWLTGRGHRVAIFDWDVHHGNGTQELFFEDASVLYLSMHEFPAYPGTGWYTEVGSGAGTGFTINVPWPTGTTGASYRHMTDTVLVPVLRSFRPDWLLVSAGYDAHRADPLAGIALVAEDYRFMAGRLATVVPAGRAVVLLEGGYDLDALRTSAAATVNGFATGPGDEETPPPAPGVAGAMTAAVTGTTARSWDL
ncbi:MAG: histone deacetylase [Acidimicrobiia bacterium]|nr:histone deacetylase [Acidimicrobiia bacterium]